MSATTTCSAIMREVGFCRRADLSGCRHVAHVLHRVTYLKNGGVCRLPASGRMPAGCIRLHHENDLCPPEESLCGHRLHQKPPIKLAGEAGVTARNSGVAHRQRGRSSVSASAEAGWSAAPVPPAAARVHSGASMSKMLSYSRMSRLVVLARVFARTQDLILL
jgi:hypothetical protein